MRLDAGDMIQATRCLYLGSRILVQIRLPHYSSDLLFSCRSGMSGADQVQNRKTFSQLCEINFTIIVKFISHFLGFIGFKNTNFLPNPLELDIFRRKFDELAKRLILLIPLAI